MPIKPLKEEVGPQVPPGTHIAICYRIVDLGTQPDKTFGDRSKLAISWELPHERITYDGEEKPMSVTRFYTRSLSKKSNLRKDLASWRSRDFTAQELEGFELRNVLGKPCQVTVVHNEEGKARVEGVTAMPKNVPAGEQHNPSVEYSIEDGKNKTFEALPDWLKKMCSACLEWNGGVNGGPEPDAEALPSEEEEAPSDVPF